jgi:Zn-dependent M28 family amino/carboxypeptidase
MMAIVVGLLLLVGLSVGGVLWMTSVPGRSHEGPLPPLTPEQVQLAMRLREHVTAIASSPHNTVFPDELERSALYIEGVLAGIGYQVYRQSFRADKNEVRNIEAVIEPTAAARDAPSLVIGAHYDSYFHAPGANDNGTGVAGVLELARLLADLRGRSSMRIRLLLFVNEEPPYFKTEHMGSLVYAKRVKQSGEPVLGMFSLETIGFYSDEAHSQRYPPPLGLLYPTTGNFVAFVGLTSSRAFVRRTVGAFRAVAPFPSVGGTAPGNYPGHRLVGPLVVRAGRHPRRHDHRHGVVSVPSLPHASGHPGQSRL